MANFTANNSIVSVFAGPHPANPPSMRNANHLNKLFFHLRCEQLRDAVRAGASKFDTTSIELITTFGGADESRYGLFACYLSIDEHYKQSAIAIMREFTVLLHGNGNLASRAKSEMVWLIRWRRNRLFARCAIHHSAFPFTSEYSLNGFAIVTTNYKIICEATAAAAASANDSH